MTDSVSRSGALGALEPRGGRIGVAFDWGFGVQLVSMGLASLVGVPFGGQPQPLPVVLGSFALGVAAFALGEGLRRGNGLAWRIQVGFHSLLTLAGLAAIPSTVSAVQQGRLGPLYTLLLLLVVSPVELWLLLQPGSRRWYGHVPASEGIARHSGNWMVGTVAYAIVCGLLQAWAAGQQMGR